MKYMLIQFEFKLAHTMCERTNGIVEHVAQLENVRQNAKTTQTLLDSLTEMAKTIDSSRVLRI